MATATLQSQPLNTPTRPVSSHIPAPHHHHHHHHHHRPVTASTMAKKAKGKKPADPTETSKLLAAKISQLEQDAAGEKDQELEIGMSSIYLHGFRLRV